MKRKLVIFGLISAIVVAILLGIVTLRNSNNSNTNRDMNNDGAISGVSSEKYIYPDLTSLKPENLYIISSQSGKELRFETKFANIGESDLRIRNEISPSPDSSSAFQILETVSGEDDEKRLGDYTYHEGHDHWHIDNMVLNELWTYDENGVLVDVVASTNKQSFCIWDTQIYDVSLENVSENRQYTFCNENKEPQGLSVGWQDIYRADIPGQSINISNVSDGDYFFMTTVNPDNKISESDYDNNPEGVFVTIVGDEGEIVDFP